MSASADYEVSVIESFTPPTNWTPGQVVKKEVAAINTGNIDAFVHQEISGKMTVTTESGVETAPTSSSTDKYVTLSDDEVHSIEAGSYLAWKPAADTTNEIGGQVVDMAEDSTSDFKPDATGLYVFRRKISVSGSGDSKTETYKYEGYYADKTGDTITYYKLASIAVTGLTIGEDGVLTASGVEGDVTAPTVTYAVEKTATVDVPLTYDEAGKRLVATYETGYTATSGSDLVTKSDNITAKYNSYLTAKAEADTAKEAYDTALTAYNNAVSNVTTKKAAYDEADKKYQAYTTAKNQLDNAVGEAKTATGIDDESGDKYIALDTALGNGTNGTNYTYTAIGTNSVTDSSTLGAAYKEYTTANSDYESKKSALEAFTNDTAETKATKIGAGKTYADENAYDNAHREAEADASAAQSTLSTKQQVLDSAIKDFKAIAKKISDAQAAMNAGISTAADKTDLNTAYGTAYGKTGDNPNTAPNGSATSAETGGAYYTKEDKLKTYNEKKNAADKLFGEYQSLVAGYDVSASEPVEEIKIYINLEEDNLSPDGSVVDKWQQIPIAAGTTVAEFYYTGILEAGETSTKLIKSVELDKDLTAGSFKNLDFDLNVAVKSAQVVYDDTNQITPKAAIDSIDGAKPSADTYKVTDTITWVAK